MIERMVNARIAALLLVFSLGVAPATGWPQEPVRPNIVVLVTDDQPFDALGCAGHPFLQTPHMDALAAGGVRFSHAFATTPICAASRASLLTGRYERSHGYTFGAPPLRPDLIDESYPVRLRAAGYRVGFVGKLGVRIGPEDRARMFDSFDAGTLPYVREAFEGRHLTERNVDRAIEFIRSSTEAPFCLSLSFQAPHADDGNPDQFIWPASCDGLYDDAVIAPPACADPEWFAALPEFLQTGMNRERWGWRFDTVEKRERMTRGYFRMLTGVDQGIGRLMKALDDAGASHNTVILLIGDNGYFLGERGYAGKWTMHDRSTRVPLIIRDPRSPQSARGRVSEVFALNIDVPTTVLALAGVPIPNGMQGESLIPEVTASGEVQRSSVFTEHLWKHPKIPRTEGVRTAGWKYIRYQDHGDFEELYNLQADPDEAHNLAQEVEHAARLKEMRAACRAYGTRYAPPAKGR